MHQSSKEMRKNAENCEEKAEQAVTRPDQERFSRMAKSWNSLADTQAWLDGDPPATNKSPAPGPDASGGSDP